MSFDDGTGPILPARISRTRESIIERVRTHRRMKGVELFVDAIVAPKVVPYDTSGILLPHAVIVFGNQAKAPSRFQGIAGVGDDISRLVFGVECYGKSSAEYQRLADDMRIVLNGFEPYNSGEVSQIYSGRIENPLEIKSGNIRFGTGLLFESYVDTITD